MSARYTQAPRLVKHHYAGQEYDLGEAVEEVADDAGAVVATSWYWFMVALGGLFAVMIVAGAALGITAFAMIIDDHNDGDIAKTFQFCTAIEAGILYFENPLIDDDSDSEIVENRTRVVIERDGNHVHVHVNGFYSAGSMSFDGAMSTGYPGTTFVGVDFRCIPLVKGAVECDTNCQDGVQRDIFDSADLTSFRSTSFQIEQLLDSGANNIFVVSGSSPQQLGSLGNLYYGVADNIITANTGTSTGVALVSAQMDFYYETTSSDDWKAPDWCGGGACIADE
jgi:hypothetical protein